MIYREIFACFDEFQSALSRVVAAAANLDQVASAAVSPFVTALGSEICTVLEHLKSPAYIDPAAPGNGQQTPNTPEQALNTARWFFGDDADTYVGALVLPANAAAGSVADQFQHAVDDLDKVRVRCLFRILQLQSSSTGVAAGNIAGEVRQTGDNLTGALRDVTTYPVLTQEIGYAPSTGSSSASSSSTLAGTNLGSTVTKALNDVLGWKSKPDDPKGFLGALNSSFTCTEIEGHVQCTWTPRTYAVASDLGGGITGAQASIYTRAKEVLDLALPLLDGLYALDPTADKEDVDALQRVARGQMTELVGELGMMGGPRISRVSQYFNLLIGSNFPMMPGTQVANDPNVIGGTLGSLREVLGLNSQTDDFINSVDDEIDLTNFRILSDYVTSLAQSWVNNLQFFMPSGTGGVQPFFGTQLVLLSRQLSVVAESVDEVRFAMDSVFIGPSERQTLAIAVNVANSGTPYTIYAEDLLSWVSAFSTEEGPKLIQDGGKYAVGDAFAAQVKNLHDLVHGALHPQNKHDLPPAYFTGRVHTSWRELSSQLKALLNFATPIAHHISTTTSRDLTNVLTLTAQSKDFEDFKKKLHSIANPPVAARSVGRN